MGFSQMFHGNMHGGINRHNQNQKHRLEVSLEEIYRGGEIERQIGNGIYKIPIEKGVRDGEELLVNADGARLNMIIRSKKHAKFQRIKESDDLHMFAVISFGDFLNGCKYNYKDISGEIRVVDIPACDRSRIVVRGQGMPCANTSARGNLLVTPSFFSKDVWETLMGWVRMVIKFVAVVFFFNNPGFFLIGMMILPNLLNRLQ